MAKQETNKDLMDFVRQQLCAISLEEKADVRTYVNLIKHKLANGRNRAKHVNDIEQAFSETSELCDIPGPLLFYRPDPTKGTRTAINISHVILNIGQGVRKKAIEYLLQRKIADYMSQNTLLKLNDLKAEIFSRSRKKWIPAALEVSDSIENDWLFNYQGVLQAVRMNFESGIGDFLTRP